MKRLLISSAVAMALVTIPASALAEAPAHANCWGVVTSQRAVSVGDIGEHASAQETPRAGLGNVARALFDLGISSGPHVSDLGSALATLDDLDSTSCP
jgi:hypothetical protein